jgi:murein DD-endopeptidase MepM/ murein hydrolase activator NlpD
MHASLVSRLFPGVIAVLAALGVACAGGQQVVAPRPGDAGGAGAGEAAPVRRDALAQPTATSVPPTPTPTPVPEPRFYAVVGGGEYFAETGFTVRDEPNGPRFWTEFRRLGGAEALGLPVSRPYDGPDGGRVQAFQRGWLAGMAGQPGVQPGTGDPPPAPAEARLREDRPEMALIGRVDIQPKEVRQGNTVLLRVWSAAAQSVTATIDGRTIPLARQGEAFVAVYGFDRREGVARPGPRPVRFTVVDASGRQTIRNDPADTIRVVDARYPTEDLVVTEATLSLLDPKKVNEEEALVNRIYSKWTPERRWRGPFISPAGDVGLTSEFGLKRYINGVFSGYVHEGVDFDVQTGDPIYAAADGTVVFAGPLHVRGNVVIIDHGWGVMTGYFHMFQTKVEAGQDVKQGDVIGLVGTTGFVTGPHLHFEVRVHNVCVEPLEWLSRPPFERPDLASL